MRNVAKKETETCFKNCMNKPVVLIAGAFVLGCLISALISYFCSARIAMVDVARIVEKSSDIAKVQENQQHRLQELQEWIKTVQAEVSKERNKQKQAELAQKYDEELQQKKADIQLIYNAEIKAIDEKMTHLISKRAKKKGYNVVLTKNSVLTGVYDLTDIVLESVK